MAWSDDIHVYDSLSTDKTLEIAHAAGAMVTQRAFDNWAAHQNWGLRNLPFKHPWVFYIDADERMTPPLVEADCFSIHCPTNPMTSSFVSISHSPSVAMTTKSPLEGSICVVLTTGSAVT